MTQPSSPPDGPDAAPPENGDAGPAPDEAAPASKSRRKREMTELQKLGERLVTLSREQIDRMALAPELEEAVLFAGKLSPHGARRRQMQRIGALMRNVDPEPIRNALERVDQRHTEEILRFRQACTWRERLLAGGDLAVEEITAAFPSIDRQRIRQWVRNIGKSQNDEKNKRQAKQLFRYILEVIAASSGAKR